jgi:polyisoprenoid-binding protein YceI
MRTPTRLAPGLLTVALGALAGVAVAAPATYNIDPSHTYPTFEADHMGGMSLWRGKINSSKGTITLDKAASTGSVDITMDMKSIDFGNQALNDHAQTPDLFDTAKFPEAKFAGKLVKFQNGAPTEVDGTLTLHGVSKPVTLKINSFQCKDHPMQKKEFCGADASTTINRADFGVNFGQQMGFKMDVVLRISVEALIVT